jgi:hypothetical protein
MEPSWTRSHARQDSDRKRHDVYEGPASDTGGKRLSMGVVDTAESCMTIYLKLLRVLRQRPAG